MIQDSHHSYLEEEEAVAVTKRLQDFAYQFYVFLGRGNFLTDLGITDFARDVSPSGLDNPIHPICRTRQNPSLDMMEHWERRLGEVDIC